MEGIINYVALGCSALALILDFVALALPSWSTIHNASLGLWKVCREDKCDEYIVLQAYLKATRALIILGLLLMAAAIAMAVLKIFVMKDKKFLFLGASASAISAGGLTLIGTIVYGVKAEEDYTKDAVLDAGFRLAVVAGVIPIVAGILFIIGRNK
ncbi:hypothetical protein ACJMK2_003805 [Sinanodonta woodiana]|uniref:Uncharacterized protein n=1 Tax=Sinanodonta woodiana TaxID=1069815 RepID=A0ABD3XZB9_SINWO